VPGHLLLKNCVEDEPTRPAIERALKDDSLLWLDLADTSADTLALLRDVFNIHPLAVEDAHEFNQRPKAEDYDDFVYIVAYGSLGLDQPMVEVHCFYAEHFFVTVHRDEVPAIADACAALNRMYTDRRLVALYRLLDALVDSMFPFLTAFDDRDIEIGPGLPGREIGADLLITAEHRRVQPVPADAQAVGEQLPAPAQALRPVVIAQRPGAQHLEHGQVPVIADLIQVGGTQAALQAG